MPKRSQSRSIELVWAGKGRRADQGSGERSSGLTPLERFPGEDARRPPNQLVFGDNLALLETLVSRNAREVDLIYLDPPFATRGDFQIAAELRGETVRGRAYRDGWGRDLGGYLTMLEARLFLARELLSARGSLYLHVDYRTSALVRCLLDEIFGVECFVNEIIWYYKTGGAPTRLGFAKKHDTIFFYVKDPRRALWTPLTEKSYLRHRYGYKNVSIQEDEHGPYTWVGCRDVFDIPALRGNQPERVDYPTQKPEALLERIVSASSAPDSLVMDPCCGSGTTLVVAQKLGRRWLGCDCEAAAIHTARKRLLELTPRPSFELLGCGRGPGPAHGQPDAPRLSARVEPLGARSLSVTLLSFGPGRDTEAVDYWAIDYDYDGAVFRPRWWAERTRARRTLEVAAPVHRYPRPGRRKVLIKACDPFGTEAERLFEVEPGA